LRTAIIPDKQVFVGSQTEIDFKAICTFAAVGFFLDRDTFWRDEKTAPPASDCKINEKGEFVSAKTYFVWHHTPREIKFDDAVEEFADLFETIVRGQTSGKRVILPLSGGLDSRTQAAAVKNVGTESATAYSYSFDGGHDETAYAKQVAEIQAFEFHRWVVRPGYLWGVIDDLAQINGCFSEFTHPRQMAFCDRYGDLGEVFNLGHWGDVLFDNMGVEENLDLDGQVRFLQNKIVKKGGLELGAALWKAWGIEGIFEDYLLQKIKTLLRVIDIPENANARLRAFKSMHWAPRWTSVNLSIFARSHEIALPYYDNRMCKFVCTLPETYLSGRKIQIEYLKRRAPKLSKITWQDHRPFDLHNYQWNKTPWNLPYRFYAKTKTALSGKGLIQRNWELQFLGEQNDQQLRMRLFDEPRLADWIPKELIQNFYKLFKQEDSARYSHSISMLLTLSLFSRHFKK
jgi:hypothetical protein